MEYPSKTVEEAINALARLPGVGRKTALRLALHLLKQPESEAELLGGAIVALRKNTFFCKRCFNLADGELCKICANPRRQQHLVCIVEDAKDVMAIESTNQFNGVYHVLGGLINPLQGVGPSQLTIEPLLERLRNQPCEEAILALSASIEGDTTAFFLTKKLAPTGVRVSSIARGIPVGLDLEFTDELTLARSLMNRTTVSAQGE
jgi:recombination protein RecR